MAEISGETVRTTNFSRALVLPRYIGLRHASSTEPFRPTVPETPREFHLQRRTRTGVALRMVGLLVLMLWSL